MRLLKNTATYLQKQMPHSRVFFKVLATIDDECDMGDIHIPGEEMTLFLEKNKKNSMV
jgi:hypothetical protein